MGFQIDDCIFQSGFNFVNLKCQLVFGIILLNKTIWHIFYEINAALEIAKVQNCLFDTP